MRTVRIVGMVIGAFVVLVGAALLLAWSLFDPNDHTSRIEEAFREATGRELQFDGGLSLSLFPWLAVETGRATIGNREGFAAVPFASLERARFGVRLWPLLSARRLEFGPVRVDGLELNLSVARDGTDNWSDILDHFERRRASATAGSPRASPTALSVARVELRDAALRYSDERAGRQLAIEDWQLGTGTLRTGTPADVETSLRLVRDGADMGHLELRTRVPPPSPEGFELEATEATLRLARAGREPLPVEIRVPDVRVARATRALQIPALDLRLGPSTVTASLAVEFEESGLAARGHLKLAESNPRAMLDALGVEPPTTRDPKALSEIEAESDFAWSADAGLRLDELDLRLDATRLGGRLALEEFAPLVARFDLRGDTMDIDRYLPPDSAPNSPPPAPSKEPEPASRSALDARGSIAFDRLAVSGVVLERVEAKMRVAEGRLLLEPLRARAFGGTVTTGLQYDYGAAEPSVRIEQRFEDVDVGALLGQTVDVGQLQGRGRGQFTLSSQGADVAALLANLDGPYEITVTNGALLGVDLWHEIERAVAAARLEATALSGKGTGRTEFERLAARGTLRDRVLLNEMLEFTSDFARVTGRGRVDYGNSLLDLNLQASLLKAPAGRVLGLDLGKVKGAKIPLRVTGSPSDPKVRPDVSKLLESAAKEAVRAPVERKIREELEKIFR